MPFGLTNAPATFCNLMNDVLYEYLDRFVVVYLDDIVIYSETLNEHVKHLRAVFQKLREYELYAKKEKCEFCCEKITFLGHVISQGQIQMDRKKAVHQGILENCKPLTDLLRKDQKWEWTVACEDAFKLLKQAISSQPVLKLPQFDRPFEVQVDASDWALGGTKFTVVTDNVANTYFKTQRKLSPKGLVGKSFWKSSTLSGCTGPGKHNDVADALSRKLVEEYVAALTVVEYDFLDQIRESSKTDVGYLKLVEHVKSGLIGNIGLTVGYFCQLDKGGKKERAGLLQPLPIPEVPWQSVSMDFITGFPKVNGMASILVVVDRFSKYGIFIAAPHACPAETAAELFFKNVTKYFGVPKDIVSDRDARFTGRFWTALFNMMGTELKFSTESSSDRWPDGEAVQRTGGKCPAAYRYARSKQELLDEAKDSLAKAQRRMKKYADIGRRQVEFSVGDQVLLKLTPQIWKKISSKSVHRGLIPKYDGPFEVMSKVGSLAYRLKLPDRLKIHPTFHVSFLKKFHQDLLDAARRQTQRAPPVIRKEFEKTVLKILDHRTMGQSKKNRRTDYLVHWPGESEADATWERDVTLWQFEEKLDEYWAVREGVTPTRACAPGRKTVSAWGDTARHSQTDGRSGYQAAVCASRRAAHSGRTAWQTRALDSAACAQHSAVVRDTRQRSAAVRTDSATVGSCTHGLGSGRQLCAGTRQWSRALGSKGWGSAAAR
ncbi:UNVERIFIED_CONTAM: Retrovirus-related Pol polyprotein from transposon.6 [Sesamum radiatum]|uniref:Retrovirus-related Pol polyprotein from transposon.6 n=1 Tax=Sesamum radiatum TaxID=300843 RepID=A0AAW2V3E4_SESRA